MARKLTLCRDDSTTQVVFENVKHYFWLGNNTVLAIAQYTDKDSGAHRYIMWPRERFCWFMDEPAQEPKPARYMGGINDPKNGEPGNAGGAGIPAMRGAPGDAGVAGGTWCGMHERVDGRWGCLKCDNSWDTKPPVHKMPCVQRLLSQIGITSED
jgi:hypothetical protein